MSNRRETAECRVRKANKAIDDGRFNISLIRPNRVSYGRMDVDVRLVVHDSMYDLHFRPLTAAFPNKPNSQVKTLDSLYFRSMRGSRPPWRPRHQASHLQDPRRITSDHAVADGHRERMPPSYSRFPTRGQGSEDHESLLEVGKHELRNELCAQRFGFKS